MAEMREEHFEVVSSNRARAYEKQKKTINIIRTLLNRYSKKQLIQMVVKESKNGSTIRLFFRLERYLAKPSI